MKSKLCFVILLITLAFTACTAKPLNKGTTGSIKGAYQLTNLSNPASPTSLGTNIPVFTNSSTPLWTKTAPLPSTPLPTIATFTPTFNPQAIVTATKSVKAVCPIENPSLKPWFPICVEGGCYAKPYIEDILNYLNQGGTYVNLDEKWGIKFADITGDGVEEYLFSDFDTTFVLGCRGGKYVVLFEKSIDQRPLLIDQIDDLNGNGIPELFLSFYERPGFHSLFIFEWNGETFRSLIQIPNNLSENDFLGTTGWDHKISDVNGNNLKEIEVIDDIPIDPDSIIGGLPWRKSTITLGWNGENFVIINKIYETPRYRFQAVQDGDEATINGDYDRAAKFYQDVIYDDNLEWWSSDRKKYETYLALSSFFSQFNTDNINPTPTPTPITPPPNEDTTEYPRLEAYAYYRLVILDLARGDIYDGQHQFEVMQKLFRKDNPGFSYLEMASAFYDAFQETNNLTIACSKAIQYAANNPEILIPLGSDYHGWQSHIYLPEDVCPFR